MILITTDLHLKDGEENQYRFDFLDHLIQEIEDKEIDYLVICGDTLDEKDNHGAKFVNKVLDYFYRLSEICELHILFGNHDGLSNDSAYLDFINKFDGMNFYTEPTEVKLGKCTALMLPHTRDPVSDWKSLNMKGFDFIFMHQTITGARASNGYEMEGLDAKFIKKNMEAEHILSGDIHVGQQIGPVTYISAPYDTRFSDGLNPRYFIYDGQIKSVPYSKAPKKVKRTIIGLDELEELEDTMRKGDMLKIDLKLPRAEWVNKDKYVSEIQDFCDEHGIINKGVKVMDSGETKSIKGEMKERDDSKLDLSKTDLFHRFCNEKQLDEYRVQIGEGVLK